MDRHQDKFYEEEQVKAQGAAVNNAEPVDDMRYFIELIKLMRDTIENSRGFGRKRFIDYDEFTAMLNDLDENLPVAIQYGLQMFSERERILGNSENEARDRITTAEMRANAMTENAKRDAGRIIADANDEAEAILADARERADFMVSEDEILRRAREEARAIKNDARIEASEERLKANHDMLQLLLGVENSVAGALDEVSRRRKELEEASK